MPEVPERARGWLSFPDSHDLSLIGPMKLLGSNVHEGILGASARIHLFLLHHLGIDQKNRLKSERRRAARRISRPFEDLCGGRGSDFLNPERLGNPGGARPIFSFDDGDNEPEFFIHQANVFDDFFRSSSHRRCRFGHGMTRLAENPMLPLDSLCFHE
jgi:hypothetical protein